MRVFNMVETVRDTLNVQRVFGEPYEQDGVTVIPAARIRGGGGGGDDGSASSDKPDAAGGGGFSVSARPVGAYVIRDGAVRWEPALDLTRVIVGGQLLVGLALLVVRSIIRRRR
jgi:uncharacterized spore protein YtfJ